MQIPHYKAKKTSNEELSEASSILQYITPRDSDRERRVPGRGRRRLRETMFIYANEP